MNEPFDFVRYFVRVHQTPFYHNMHVGMAEFALLTPGMQVLDMGCGPGRLVEHLWQQGVAVVGADGDPCMVARARELYPQRPFVATLAEDLPFANGRFDTVLAGNILFFLDDPLAALREMGRVVRPGGRVVTWNPSEQMNLPAALDYITRHPEMTDFGRKHLVNWCGVAETNRRWSSDDLAALFAAAGLTNFETITTLDGLARYGRGERR
jgi:demethylmenaquinone methyltransferase/2-methoxy-6-polyprenyl-1,4-benzoquinol methylase